MNLISYPNKCVKRSGRAFGSGGMVLLTVLVVLSVSLVLIGGLVQSLVREHRSSRLRHQERQCRRLAEAGIARAHARLRADENFDGEEWQIPASELGGGHSAVVSLGVEQSDAGGRVVTATAAWPAGDAARIRHTERSPLD